MSEHSSSLRTSAIFIGFAAWIAVSAQPAEVTLLDTPVKVTATIQARAEGGYAAQIGVHNGPIAQLVSTTTRGGTQAAAESALRKQVQWRAPYLFVHSSCDGNVWRCEGEVVFRVMDGAVTRLGDLIGTASGVFKNGHFYDHYDKLEQQVPGLSHASSPSFVIVLDEVNGLLQVNAEATWSSNAAAWREHAAIANTQPNPDGLNAEWQRYFSAVVSNAALARYCNKAGELQQLLNAVNPVLDADQRRLLTDALSKVVPLERPRAWRTPY
jgi:hypothetical protein